MVLKYVAVVLGTVVWCMPLQAQDCNTLFDTNQLLTIHLDTIIASDWDVVRGDATYSIDKPANLRCAGETNTIVAVRRKESPALPSEGNPQKVSLSVDINFFLPDQTWKGLKRVTFENGVGGMLLEEGFAWQAMAASGMLVSQATFVNLVVNGNAIGVFTMVEQVDKAFLQRVLGGENGWFLWEETTQKTRTGQFDRFGAALCYDPFDNTCPQPALEQWPTLLPEVLDVNQLLTVEAVNAYLGNTQSLFSNQAGYMYYSSPAPRLYFPWNLHSLMFTDLADHWSWDIFRSGLVSSPYPGTPYQWAFLDHPQLRAQYTAIMQNLIDGPLGLATLNALLDSMETTVGAAVDADPYQDYSGTAAQRIQAMKDWLALRDSSVRDQLDTDAGPDCNDNGVPDDQDVGGGGGSADCNSNGIPDECEPDCNTNTFPDSCDIASLGLTDCGPDFVPDECQPDCNSNGVADSCDLADGTSFDSNFNLIPDDCELGCDTPFNPDQILEFHIDMDSLDWDAIRFDTTFLLEVPAFFTCGNEAPILVAVRRKSSVALPSEGDPQKIALKIDINELDANQTWRGFTKLSLENGAEQALIEEGFAWQLMRRSGAVASRSAWVKVFVNGVYRGLYTLVEQVDRNLVAAQMGNDDFFMFKEGLQITRTSQADPYHICFEPFDDTDLDLTDESCPQPPLEDWPDLVPTLVDMDQLLTIEAVNLFLANEESLFTGGLLNYWYYDWSLPRFYLPWDLDDLMADATMDIYTGGPGGSTTGTPYQIDLLVNQPVFRQQYRDIMNGLLAGPLDEQALFDLLDRIEGVIGAQIDADPLQDYTETAAQRVAGMKIWLTQRIASVRIQLDRTDFDHDGDTDLFDFGAFAVCHTGDLPAQCASQACQDTFDSDNDCDVDEVDYAEFLPLLTGP